MIITSSSNDKIKSLKKLNTKKYRDEKKIFLVEGHHLVEEAFKYGILKEIILLENEDIYIDVKKTYVTLSIMKELSSLTTPPKVIGLCTKIENNKNLGKRLLLLDGIQDPGNLGTIMRSALAFNIDTIVLGDKTVDMYNPKVLRATQGLIFAINIIEEDLNKFIPLLKEDNYRIIGTNLVNGRELNEYQTPSKYALIMGNEGQGISDDITKLCDDFIYINMNNKCESLNVAIACSIILYHLNKR